VTASTAKMAEVEILTGEIVPKRRNRRQNGKARLQPHEELSLKRELAAGDVTQAVLAKKYGITQPGISMFAKRHAIEIADIADHMNEQFAGLPLARKENRIASYEREIEILNEHPHASHHEWAKARMIAYRNMAEELGQLPPRQTVTVIPVTHVIEGVSMEDL